MEDTKCLERESSDVQKGTSGGSSGECCYQVLNFINQMESADYEQPSPGSVYFFSIHFIMTLIIPLFEYYLILNFVH